MSRPTTCPSMASSGSSAPSPPMLTGKAGPCVREAELATHRGGESDLSLCVCGCVGVWGLGGVGVCVGVGGWVGGWVCVCISVVTRDCSLLYVHVRVCVCVL